MTDRDPTAILNDLAVLADCDPPQTDPVGATLRKVRTELGKVRLGAENEKGLRQQALEFLELTVWRCYHWRDLGYRVQVRHAWYKAPRRALAARESKRNRHLIYYLVRMSSTERLANRIEHLIFKRS